MLPAQCVRLVPVGAYDADQLLLPTGQPQWVQPFAKEMGELCQAPLYLRRFLIGIDDPKITRRHTRTQVTEEPEMVLSRRSLHTVCDSCLYERSPVTPAVVEDGKGARVGIEDSLKICVHRLPRARPAHERQQRFVFREFMR